MKRPSFLFTSILTVALWATTASAQETAEALLKKMEATYAGLKSYSDTTSVRYHNPDGAAGASAECKIWFARPAFFRIDGEARRAPEAPVKREVIWADGEGARAWSTSRAVTMLDKIQLAGSKMFGTYAYHIPTLLEKSYGGPRRLHELERATLAGEEEFDGIACHRLEGKWLADPYRIWIGKADSLVRKITANYSGYEMEEIHRAIVVDQPIPKAIFQFAPEKENAASPAPRKSE